jgi:hypothetical protein
MMQVHNVIEAVEVGEHEIIETLEEDEEEKVTESLV